MSIRILIADDHAIVRDGLATCIKNEDDMEVVGQARNGHEAVELASRLNPDLVIMDVSMPELNGVEAARIVRQESPQTKVIALSMHSAGRFVREMFKAGADGYLLKDCEFDEMVDAIHAVADGKKYVTPEVGETIVREYTGYQEEDSTGIRSPLTVREREVLQLLAEGNGTKQTARRLCISPKTVEAHRLNMMRKLNIDNIAELTKYAIREGLVSSEL